MTDTAHSPCALGVPYISPVGIHFLLSEDEPEIVEQVLFLNRRLCPMTFRAWRWHLAVER